MAERIVVAEDETEIRTNLTRMLRLEGFEVLAAPNGAEALTLIQRHVPDLVLSDVMMPGMSGHELVQAIRANPQTAHIPTVLLTARADRSDVREGMNLGADDYLTKPFQRDELLACIRSRLDKSRALQEANSRLAGQAHRLSHYDAVTDLPNRTHFLLLLGDLLEAEGPRKDGPCCGRWGWTTCPNWRRSSGPPRLTSGCTSCRSGCWRPPRSVRCCKASAALWRASATTASRC